MPENRNGNVSRKLKKRKARRDAERPKKGQGQWQQEQEGGGRERKWIEKEGSVVYTENVIQTDKKSDAIARILIKVGSKLLNTSAAPPLHTALYIILSSPPTFPSLSAFRLHCGFHYNWNGIQPRIWFSLSGYVNAAIESGWRSREGTGLSPALLHFGHTKTV